MKLYGLVGKNIAYSFSRKYFQEKFKNGNIDADYQNFDIENIIDFKKILVENPNLNGLNVTIPYKEKVIPFLDEIDEQAQQIGAVNTIKFDNQKLMGYNTDAYGFMKALFPLLEKQHQKALILGKGGASKAITHVLESMDIDFTYVSRNPQGEDFSYTDVNKEIIESHKLIINCTPLGTYPNVNQHPEISYEYLTSQHLLFDLVYNPAITTFLALGKQKNCKIANGQKMLEYQAERAWEIWNS
ncbi:shikimate dehydrogenase [Mesonia sp. K7]|uniref:shikimate dehydrogenase family protein n=1 Tax=Mesonia sp. K7 TaxID=2218606 RepID=UPI000DA7875C|nr:shikimate dehydrogenase [Mesonia sp. K7]PZD79466.1 shikimate dehydrogenase [Mesonia sp. K7]